MGVLITDEPDETLLDVRLAGAKDCAKALESRLRRAYFEATAPSDREELACLVENTRTIEHRLAELISTRNNK